MHTPKEDSNAVDGSESLQIAEIQPAAIYTCGHCYRQCCSVHGLENADNAIPIRGGSRNPVHVLLLLCDGLLFLLPAGLGRHDVFLGLIPLSAIPLGRINHHSCAGQYTPPFLLMSSHCRQAASVGEANPHAVPSVSIPPFFHCSDYSSISAKPCKSYSQTLQKHTCLASLENAPSPTVLVHYIQYHLSEWSNATSYFSNSDESARS